MADIPPGVRSILDVGCGAGNTAHKLLDRGYEVDCVSPNAWLTTEARRLLGTRARVFESKFENLTLDRTYDLILFSESFLFMVADRLERLTTIYTTPGFTDERIHLFLAQGLTAGRQDREADEFLELREVRWREVLELIRRGEISDGKTLSCLMFVECFRRR